MICPQCSSSNTVTLAWNTRTKREQDRELSQGNFMNDMSNRTADKHKMVLIFFLIPLVFLMFYEFFVRLLFSRAYRCNNCGSEWRKLGIRQP